MSRSQQHFAHLFQSFAFAPTGERLSSAGFFAMHLGVVATELSLIFVHRHETFHSTSPIGSFLDVIQVLAPILTHLVMLVETACQAALHRRLLSELALVDTLQSGSQLVAAHRPQSTAAGGHHLVRLHWTMLVLLVLCVATECAVITSVYKDYLAFARSWYFRLFSLNSVRIGVVQILWFVDAIGEALRRMRSNCSAEKSRDRWQVARVHLLVWKCATDMNRRFAWSLLALGCNFFICITIGLYWVTLRFVFSRWDLMFEAALIVIAPLVTLLILIQTSTNCQHAVKQFRAAIPGAKNRPTKSTRLLALQVQLLPIAMTGGGFFNIDHSLLGAIIAAIASYLFLIFSIKSSSF